MWVQDGAKTAEHWDLTSKGEKNLRQMGGSEVGFTALLAKERRMEGFP